MLPYPIIRRLLRYALAALLAGYLGWLVFNRAGITARAVVDGATLVLFSLAAAGLVLRSAARVTLARLRASWLAFNTGLLLLAGYGGLAVFQALGPTTEFPVGEPLRLAALVAFLVGVVLYPRQRHPQLNSLATVLNLAIAFSAALALGWLGLIQPLMDAVFAYVPSLLYAVAGYALLVTLMMAFLSGDPRYQPAPSAWVNLAVIAYGLASLLHPVQMLGGEVVGLLETFGWPLGAFWLAFDVLTRGSRDRPFHRRRPDASRLLGRLQNMLPHLLTLLAAVVTAVDWLALGYEPRVGLWVTVALVLAVIVRQVFWVGQVRFQQYANLVNSIAEPAFVCDDNGLLVLVNPALLAATGYPTPKELLGRHLSAILDPQVDTRALLNHASARLVQPGDTIPLGWSGETGLRRRNGDLLPVYLSLRPVQNWGDPPDQDSAQLAMAGTAHDLTGLKRQQEALQQTYEQLAAAHAQLEALNAELEQKVAEETANLSQAYAQLEEQNRVLQTLDRLKSDFVSLVSHELRAPLTNISGGIELVLSRPVPLDPGVQRNLELVQAEILRLTRFVETILDLSALDAGRLPLYPAPISFETIVSALQNQLTHRPGLERIHWQAPADLPYLMADERALTSVLFHLVDNAIKYAPQGKISVAASVENGLARVDVLDEGPGIPPEALPLLFDRFYRSNNTDSQTVYGHGLGLYIVRRLMEAVGGRVEAANRPEGGAMFTLWFKIADPIEERHDL